MNTLILLMGLRPWSSPTSTAAFTRVFIVVSVVSIEAQVVTLARVGALWSFIPLNAVGAVAAFLWWRPSADPGGLVRVRPLQAVPPLAFAAMAALVLLLNLSRPFEAADPYHLDKVDRIQRTGTLAYDPGTETKINILNSTYEMLLADLTSVPMAGPWIVRVHGFWGLLLFVIAVGAVREQLGRTRRAPADRPDSGPVTDLAAPARWTWAVLLVVPVLFHQFVLVKNDLLVGVLSFVVLAWTIARAKTASTREVVWASWLAALAVAVKLTSLALLVILAAALLLQQRSRWKTLGGLVLGGILGAASGGLFFTLIENVRTYGSLMPIEDLGNRPRGVFEMAVDIFRFNVSLVDLGQLTRRWWPGRGGWGGTFGLPLVWAAVALALRARVSPTARAALLCTGGAFLAFSGAFPDADVAQRLVLGPGLLLVAVAVNELDGQPVARDMSRLRIALAACGVVSSLQVARSAWLYMS